MSKSSYLKVKYQIPYEYHSFTKSKTKHLDRYLLFKLISNLLVEMYYSISCYKLLTRSIASRFSRNYKYVYVLRVFITNFLNYLSKYRDKTNLYLRSNNVFFHWNPYLNSNKSSTVNTSPYVLFIKFFTLLLQRRSAFAVVLRKEKTILYYVRQISNYVFYEKHMQILSSVKQSILNFDLKKRIIDSIFNVGRYSRKSRFLNKKHIFNLVSFNMILSTNRFDRLKRGRKNRTFYSNKLKFMQLYKNMYNIRTTNLFKKYIKHVSSRLRRFVGISSVHFHQIYAFILSYFFYYLSLFGNTAELYNVSLRINSNKYSVSSYYYFLIGDRIEIGSTVFNYLIALRKLSIAFVLSQIFYNCSVIPIIKLRLNKNRNKILSSRASIMHINKYFNTSTTNIPTGSINSYHDTQIVTKQALGYIRARLKQYHLSYNSVRYHRRISNIRKKKWKVYLSKKFIGKRNKYHLIGHVLDSAISNMSSKIYILAAILGVYTCYSDLFRQCNAYCSYDSTIWFKNILPLSATHLRFIAASSDCSTTAHSKMQLCTSNITRLLDNLNIGCLFNLNMRIDSSLYTQYFNLNRRLRYYIGFFNHEDILLSLATNTNRRFRVRRLYSTGGSSLLAGMPSNLQVEENTSLKATMLKQYINTIFKLIRHARKLVSARIYRTIYYCLTKIIRLTSISKQHGIFMHRILENYNSNNIHLQFFPIVHEPYNYIRQDNLIRNTAALLYLRRCITYNRKLTKLVFFRIRKKFKKKKRFIDKFEQSLKREYNFSIIQNNDYFRRLGVYDLYSFIKKVFIDKTMPAYNSKQYNSYFNQHNNKRMRYSLQRPTQYNTNTGRKYKFRRNFTPMHNRMHSPKFNRSYYTDSIAKMDAQVYTEIGTTNRVGQSKGRVRVKLVNDIPRPHMYNIKPVIYQNNKKNKFNKGTNRLNINRRNKSKRNNFGSLVIAMLHRILNTRYLQSNRLHINQQWRNSRPKGTHHKQLARSIANDNVIDLYYLSSLDKQFRTVHSHDDLSYILTKVPNYKNTYSTMYLRILSNVYLYLKYLKQWLYTYSLNTLYYFRRNSIILQLSTDLMKNLKTIANYHTVQRKFICINPLLHKTVSNKLRFIVYNYTNIPHTRDSTLLSMPNNLRYLFLNKSSKILASKFR